MFKRILIANRGEIACRIARSARRLGLSTVAIHSTADENTPHVRMADEAVCVGPPASAESYLNIEAVVEAARATGADAVHPGFGFLSENADFVEALAAAGIVFIGPGAEAMRAMGDKIESRRFAVEAGVNTVPGVGEALADMDEAVAAAERIGYPVMLKASAGGGGKGMRIATNVDEVRDGFRGATNEAVASFGDGRLFVERYVEQPRHIEIQVLADRHGTVLHLGERECSVQRRHQKVLEEAPSPFVDEALRNEMGAQAVALARAAGYESAGTVEFIVDPARNFYFLEMNTRLQVEHPVTEAVTGIDLVEWMIRIAAGEPLPFAQEDIALRGWAMEARVYAEDPERGFLPATGRLRRYRPPLNGPVNGAEEGALARVGFDPATGVRVDDGVEEGGEIPVWYDPMIAKLATAGATREEACARLAEALDRYTVRGVITNLPFLAALVRHPAFRAGELSTAFIDEHFPDGFDPARVRPPAPAHLVALAAWMQWEIDRLNAAVGRAPGADIENEREYVVLVGEEGAAADAQTDIARHIVRLRQSSGDGGDEAEIEIGNERCRLASAWRPGLECCEAMLDGERLAVQVEREPHGFRLAHAGHVARYRVLSPRAAELRARMPVKLPPDLSRMLCSPMPGLLTRIAVEAGQQVKAGEEVAVVEAMKMENVLRAERDATVAAVLAEPGAILAVDQPIVEFE